LLVNFSALASMPPKKGGTAPLSKSEQKKKVKVVEDKTFGLKNKNKSKSVQKYVKGVETQHLGAQKKRDEERKAEKKRKEEEENERLRMEAQLFKPTVAKQTVPVGVDPKSLVCEFFKKGLCTKGDKCKFSHDIAQERKSEKIDLYTDRRDVGAEKLPEEDSMETWDQNKLESVVETRHGGENKQSNKTKIVCKYFLEAVENRKYGWFWTCPNGGDKCMYIHALPPGYVLKVKSKEPEEEVEEVPMEDILEEERTKLTTRTPLTLELFKRWKEDKRKEKVAKDKEAREKRDSDIKAGKVMRSGREMFVFNPELFIDDDDVMDTSGLEPEEEGPVIHIDATGTSISLNIENGETMENGKEEEGADNNSNEDNSDEHDEHRDEDDALAVGVEGVKIQEELFTEDLPDAEDDDEDEEQKMDEE